jgi:hypothetical protein
MRLKLSDGYDKQRYHRWFAWHPVVTKDGFVVWLAPVYRKWDSKKYLTCIDPYDLGEYEGGWDYLSIP